VADHESDPERRGEPEARTMAEAAAAHSAFLLQAVERLSLGMRDERVYRELLDLIVPEFADMAAVRVLAKDGSLRVLAAAPEGALGTSTSERDVPVSALTASYRPGNPAYRVIETGEVHVIDDLERWLAQHAPSPEYRDHLRARGVKRVAFFPLRSQGETMGLLSVAMCTCERGFDPARVQLFEALGRHAALAMENARLLESAEALRKAAEDANVAKDQVLATVSHELRNPLSAILGWVRVLRTGKADGAQLAKGLEIIERNALAQSQLIEDMLDVSRIEIGKLKLALRPAVLQHLIENALDSARPAADAKGVRLIASVAPGVGACVVDPDRMQQVIWNLISNAVKFTPRGGSVEVSCRQVDLDLELVVADTGQGIPPEFVPYAFDKFRQGDQGPRVSGGLGIGLAIVRHVVELHGGTVRAESEGLGMGARFTVRLPIRTG
jgi:signal transduction histidine kinase